MGSTAQNIKMIVLQWKYFKEQRRDIFSNKQYSKLKDSKNALLGMIGHLFQCKFTDPEDYSKLLIEILNLNSQDLYKILYICSETGRCIVTSVRSLFDVWKRLLEKITIEYCKVKKIEIKKFPKSDSSSPLLYFLYHKRPNYTGQTIDISYDYKGWCAVRPLERLTLLLSFPVNELIKNIDILQLPSIYENLYRNITKILSVNRKNHKIQDNIAISETGDVYTDLALNFEVFINIMKNNECLLLEEEVNLKKLGKAIERVAEMVDSDITETFL